MPTSPEELLRSIERTREELALTVDTIAGRLDPRAAAKRGVGKVRSGVTGMFDGARRSRHEELASFDGAMSTDREVGATAREVGATAREAAGSLGVRGRQVPTPALAAALAALAAFAAILAVRSRRRRPVKKSHH